MQEKFVLQNFIASYNNLQNILPHGSFEERG